MKVSNGYVWSKKYKCWRKLPRRAWLKVQRNQVLRSQNKRDNKERHNDEKE